MDIRSSSYLEKYNKDIKEYLSENKDCNWAYFLGFRNSEITRIENKLITEQNKNVRFKAKKNKI